MLCLSALFSKLRAQVYKSINRMTMDITYIWKGPNILGESPVWDARAQKLYWVDGVKAEVHQIDPITKAHQQWQLPNKIAFIILKENGDLLVILHKELVFLNPITGKITAWLAPFINGKTRFNEGKCDRRGRLWLGTADIAEKNHIGSLYRLDPDGKLHEMDHGFVVSNGIGWSPDNKIMYFSDSAGSTMYQYDYDFAKGTISNRKIFENVPPSDGYPDGLTVDSRGYIWSARWNGWQLKCYKPDGSVAEIIKTPFQVPTSCCFGGADLKTLFVTSATRDLTPQELQQAPLSGGLFAIDLNVEGLAETFFKISH